MYNGASRWGQAFNHWGLAVFFAEYTWLFKGVTFVFLLSFPLSLPFDWTLRCWVCVCCFVLFYFGYYVVLCVKKIKIKIVDNKKKTLINLINFNNSSTSNFAKVTLHNLTDLHVKMGFYGGVKAHCWKGAEWGAIIVFSRLLYFHNRWRPKSKSKLNFD